MGGWFLAEARRVLRLAAPVAAAYLLNKTTSLVSLKFAGELGTDELAAASLAQTLWNVTGISLLVGMSIGMQTVIAQAFGSKDFHAVGVTVHRAAFLFALLLVPLSALHCTMGPVLRGVGIPPVIAAHAAAYILRLVPGLWAYGGITVVVCWCQSIGVPSPGAWAWGGGWVLHVGFTYAGFHAGGLNGIAYAASASTIAVLALLCLIVRFQGVTRTTWVKPSRDSLRDLGPLVLLSLPGLLIMSEWWASEISIIMAGKLGEAGEGGAQLSAMAIYQSCNSFFFMLSMCLGVAGATRTGNELGRGEAVAAKRAALTALLLQQGVGLLVGLLIFAIRRRVGALFVDDALVSELVAKNLSVLAVYVVFDGLQVSLVVAVCSGWRRHGLTSPAPVSVQSVATGILKGVGRQRVAVPVVLFAYYCVGLPLAYFFGFRRGWGTVGLCTGMLLGTITHTALILVPLVRLDWDEEVEICRRRLKAEKLPTLSSFREAGEVELQGSDGDDAGGAEGRGGEDRLLLLADELDPEDAPLLRLNNN